MKRSLRIIALSLAAAPLLGNIGCGPANAGKFKVARAAKSTAAATAYRKDTDPAGRTLKREIELEKISTAAHLLVPGANSFDFEFVLNAQIYDVIEKSNRFVTTYNPTIPGKITPQTLSLLAEGQSPVVVDFSADPYAVGNDPNKCLIYVPQIMVSGSVLSFEMHYGGGFFFGITPGGAKEFVGAGTTIGLEQTQLAIQMDAFKPLTRKSLAVAKATPEQFKFKVDLLINFAEFAIGPKFFYQNPLANVTLQGLKNAMAKLAAQLDTNAIAQGRPLWEARVIRDDDTSILVRAGRLNDIKVGDEFEIYNMDHEWEDMTLPCESRYVGSTRRTTKPIAIARVTEEALLDDGIVRLVPLPKAEGGRDADGTRAEPGAQVVIHKLAP